VEGENEATQQQPSSHPPIAQLTCFEGESDQQIEEVIAVAASTLSESLGIPGNTFLTYHEAPSGQVVAGNGIVRKKEEQGHSGI